MTGKAVITGASDGIGREVALALSREGINVVLMARDEGRLEKVAEKCRKEGVGASVVRCDVRDVASVRTAMGEVEKNHKGSTILVNVAGIWQKMGGLEGISYDVIQDVVQTNLTGVMMVTKGMLPILKRKERAFIVNISSKSGVTAQDGQSVYTASKWGVRGFTETLKADLRESGVRVCGVYQSGTDTEMFAKTGESIPEAVQAKFTKPKDLGEVIAFILTRPDSLWIHEIRVEF